MVSGAVDSEVQGRIGSRTDRSPFSSLPEPSDGSLRMDFRRTLMGWLSGEKKSENSRATELSQLKEELRGVSEKLESRESELAEALEQQTATSEICA